MLKSHTLTINLKRCIKRDLSFNVDVSSLAALPEG